MCFPGFLGLFSWFLWFSWFSWYSSFYFVNDADKNFTNQTGTVIHGYGEVKQVGSDVVVMSAHSPLGPDTPSIETRIVYTGGSVTDLTYNYKMSGLTGGGAFMNNKIRKKVLSNNFSFWLNWNAETLLKRIKKNKKRPIAFNSSDTELMSLIKSRSKIYSKAQIKINCNNLKKSEIIEKILKIYEPN